MNKPPAFQLYAREWLVGTAHLSLSAQGAYIRLLSHEWEDGPLPDDDKYLARLLGLSVRALHPIRAELARHFPLDRRGNLANRRLEHERAKLVAYREAQSIRRGGQPPASPEPAPTESPPDADIAVSSLQLSSTSLLAEFPDTAHRDAVETALRGQHPQAVEHTIRGLHDGTTRAYPFPVIGRALVELQAAGTTFSANALDAFCRRIQAGDPPPRQRGPERLTQREKNLAVLSRIAAEEEVA